MDFRREASIQYGEAASLYSTSFGNAATTGVDIVSILLRFEQTCSKLLEVVSLHSTRLMNIEYNLGVVLACKLDTLIGVNIKMNDGLAKLSPPVETPMSQEAIPQTPLSKLGEKMNRRFSEQQSPIRAPENLQLRSTESLSLNSVKRWQSFRQNPCSELPIIKENSVVSLGGNGPEKRSMILSTGPESGILTDTDFQLYVRKVVGSLCRSSTEEMYHEFCQKKLQPRELKALFAWRIMKFCVGFTQEIKQFRRSSDHNKRTSLITIIDQSLRRTLEYLIEKHPPSKHKIVDTEIAKYVVELRNHTDLENDMLRNAGMSFASKTGKSDFTRDIKIWINRLLLEVKAVFPKFKKNMEDIFRGFDNSSMNEENDEVEYEIGKKLSDNIGLYSEKELDEPGLEIKSPEVGRVLTKWIEELHRLLFNPERVLKNVKSGFKNMRKSNAIYFTEAMKKELAGKLHSIANEEVQALHKAREHGLFMAISEVLTLVQAGFEGHEELDQEQIICLNAAKYLNQYGNVHILVMLNTLLESLNSVRDSYPSEKIQSNIDLVTCNILDLIRCKCVGSKRDVRRIYQTLAAHSEYEIIRVKIKLNESTRDILINFKCRGSFLIGEMQIALGSKDERNEQFCHYLYELQRSLFPVLYQVSSQLASYDSRMAYFNNGKHTPKFRHRNSREEINQQMTFHLRGLSCAWRHEATEMIYLTNSVPFCCTLCSQFFGAYKFGLEFLKCSVCGIKVCPKCAIEKDKRMEGIYINKNIHWERIKPFLRSLAIDCSFCTGSILIERLTHILSSHPYVLLLMFTHAGMKFVAVKFQSGKVIETFFSLYERQLTVDLTHESWNCIMLPQQPRIHFIRDIRLLAKLTLDDQPCYDLEKSLERKGLDCIIGIIDRRSKKILVMDIPEDLPAIQTKMNLENMKKYIAIENSKPDPSIELTSKQLTDLVVLDGFSRPEAVKTLNFWGNKLTNLQPLIKFKGLTELILRENLIQSITGILPHLKGLKILNLQRNSLRGSLPALGLPELTLLDLSKNQLDDVRSLESESLPHIKILYLSFNQLKRLPVLTCPSLEVYSFTDNKLTSLDELLRSSIAKVKRIRALKNQIQGSFPKLNYSDLTEFHIEHNELTSIETFGLCNIPSIQSVTLSNNKIAGSLPELKLPKLKKLLLNNNQIQSCQEMSRWVIPTVLEIDLSNNLLSPTLPALNLPSLKTLLISHNKLTDIHGLTIGRSTLTKLQKLDLSHNEIQKLAVMSMGRLQILDLSNNSLRSLEELSEQQMPILERLDLSNNRLHCRVPILHMPSLQELVLDGNNVEELTCLHERQLIPSIKKIYVKENNRLNQRGDVLLFDGEVGTVDSENGVLLRRKPVNCKKD